ncbi:MAG: TonB-dependent receptor domain-containing protein, partial [Candidatus Binatia bacterium]
VIDLLLGGAAADLPELGETLPPLEAFIENTALEKTDSKAIFSDVTWSILDGLRLFAGVRYTKEEKEQILTSRITLADGGAPVVDSCDRLRTTLDYEATTGRAGLQVDVLEDAMLYGQFAKGFKAGGFAVSKCSSPFRPEKLDAYELGFKSTWLDGRLRANGAGYHYDYDDLQVEEVNLPSLFVNNAQAEVDGGEVELGLLLMSDLELFGNLAYLDARYTEFVNDDNTDSLQAAFGIGGTKYDLSGNRLNRSPEWSGGGGFQYTLDLDGWGRFVLRGEATGKSKIFLREFNNATDFQKAHWIVNGFLTWMSPGGAIAIRGFVRNATDEAVLAGLVGIAGYKTAAFNPPRLMGLSMEYRFGS